MKSGLLDLDVVETWLPHLEPFRASLDVGEMLFRDQDGEGNLFEQLGHAHDCVADVWVAELQEKARQVVLEEFASVSVCHACRPFTDGDYIERGILRTNRPLLESLAHRVFSGVPGFDEVFEGAVEAYLDWYDGTVGLFLCKEDAVYQQPGWVFGSKFIRDLADKLGDIGGQRLRSYRQASKPTLVKCTLPITWLDKSMREPSSWKYATALLQKTALLCRHGPGHTALKSGALKLRRDIPQENITEFIDVSHLCNASSWQLALPSDSSRFE